jgi:CDP-diacylglycerol---glycerol-3-phosphate 3-phosphatidyltransferase
VTHPGASSSAMNLPNALTIGRIAVTPLVAVLPFIESPTVRFAGFALFVAAAVTDHFDGAIARSRGCITDLGKLLDPLADKLLLVGTFVPMFLLQHPEGDAAAALIPWVHADAAAFPFETVFGPLALPWWVLAVVLGRELFMTLFRRVAQQRGVVIAAIGPAKWKAGFQFTWIGAAYCWFGARTLADTRAWDGLPAWEVAEAVIGHVGAITMIVAVLLTLYSLGLYVARYGYLLRGGAAPR